MDQNFQEWGDFLNIYSYYPSCWVILSFIFDPFYGWRYVDIIIIISLCCALHLIKAWTGILSINKKITYFDKFVFSLISSRFIFTNLPLSLHPPCVRWWPVVFPLPQNPKFYVKAVTSLKVVHMYNSQFQIE